MPHATAADLEQGAAPPQHGMASEADVLPEQSFGAAAEEYGRKMNPVAMAQGISQNFYHPIEAIKRWGDVNNRILSNAEDAAKRGDYTEAAAHALHYVLNGIPGLGEALDEAGTKMREGDIAGGLADTAALGTQIVVGAKAPAIAKGVANAAVNTAKYVGAAAPAAAPGVLGGMAKAGAGEVLAKLPGMELPARFGLQYPALRQVAKAIEKGHEAGMKAVRGTEAAPAAEATNQVPIRASRAASATAPPAATSPEVAPAPETAPAGPGKTAADLLNEEMGTKEVAPPITAKLPGQALAESHGETWSKLSQDDKLAYAQLEGAQASSEARNAAAPSAYTPRPPEYYGVKAAEAPPPQPPPSAPAPAQATSAAPSVTNAPKPMVMYHGSPKADLTELQPGSMMSNEVGWPAGYTTKINPDMTEDFTGKIYSSRPQYQNPVYANTLHGAEGKLLELAEQTGQPYKSLKDAANVVNSKYGIDAIVARNTEGQITGVIPLKATPVEQALDPAETLSSYNGPIASNIQAAMERAKTAPSPKVQPIRPAPPAEAEDIDFQQRYGEQEQPEVAKFLGHEQPATPSKEPWQMTQEEYLDSYEARTRPEIAKEVNRKVGELQAGVERMRADIASDPGNPANGGKQAWIADTQKTIQEQTNRLTAPLTNPRETWSPAQIQWHHVGHALEQGKPVPPEALAAYPELAPKPAPEPPAPKPASGATAAKSARYADAISKWAKDMGMSPKDIADQWGTTTPEVRGQILLQLKQKGYLGANETIPRTSAQGIVDALKAKATTIKPPKGFSMGEMGTKQ